MNKQMIIGGGMVLAAANYLQWNSFKLTGAEIFAWDLAVVGAVVFITGVSRTWS